AVSRSMVGLVEDPLDISGIVAGKVKLSPENFSPRGAVDSFGLILQPQARQKQLEYLVVVEDAVPALVHGDAVHLRQVLLNLVGNAVKFTDAGRVRVDVSLAGASDGQVVRLRFAVSDTGIGILESMRERLFEA